jgi:hypothetical protein
MLLFIYKYILVLVISFSAACNLLFIFLYDFSIYVTFFFSVNSKGHSSIQQLVQELSKQFPPFDGVDPCLHFAQNMQKQLQID